MPNNKTILYLVTQSETGGVQQYIFDLANALKQEFNIIVAFGEQGEQGELAARLKEAGVEFFALKHLKRSISPFNDLLALLEIIKLIKKTKPDIIHLNSSKISILGSLAALCVTRYALRVVYTVHGWVFNEPLPLWKKKFYFFAEKLTAKYKDRLICVSEFDRQIALNKKIYPAPGRLGGIALEKNLITIHNGIAPINFLSRDEARQKLSSQISKFPAQGWSASGGPSQGWSASGGQFPISNIIIGSIANLYKTKGLEYLVQAAKILISNFHSPITFVIIGEGEERKNLEDLIAQLNLKNNFLLAGKIDKAAELLPAFDLYVCSSVKEGLSYTIIEAMQAGLPIVATTVGGNQELIADNKTGLLIEPKNPQALAEKMYQLLNSPGLSRELGENAKQKALREFSMENMIKNTKDAYLKL